MNYTEPTEGQMTKKERRQERRQEARVEQAKAARGRGFRRFLTWGIVVVVLVGIGWLVWRAAQNAPGTSPTGGAELTVPVGPGDTVKGNEDAAIELVEYGDYQCSACAAFHPVVEQIFADAGGDVRVVYRHFPLKSIHPNAEMVSQAVQAAGLQGKYWEMHNIVFERQQEWAPIPRNSARNKMLDYARELGLNSEQLDSDMDSDVVKDKVDADIESGNDAGVNSTPSFFVNGRRISGANSLDEFVRQILGAAPAAHDAEAEPVTESNDATEGTAQEDL